MNYIKNSLFLFYISSHIWTGTQATILNLRRMYDCCSTGNHFLFRSMQKQIIFNLSACLNTIFVVCLYFSFHCVFTIISWIEQTKKHRIDLRCTINVLINWPADRVFIDDTKWVCVCAKYKINDWEYNLITSEWPHCDRLSRIYYYNMMMYCCWLIFGSIQNECEESHPMILLNTGECGLWDLVQALVWTDITKFIVFKMYALNIYIYITDMINWWRQCETPCQNLSLIWLY